MVRIQSIQRCNKHNSETKDIFGKVMAQSVASETILKTQVKRWKI